MTEMLQFALTLASVVSPIILAAFLRDRQLQLRINAAEMTAIKTGFEARTYIDNTYVRRQEYRETVERFEDSINEMRGDFRSISESMHKMSLDMARK